MLTMTRKLNNNEKNIPGQAKAQYKMLTIMIKYISKQAFT